ncbi:hypothetical protein GCM10027203_36480 [Nonomuraea fastidiosa]
MVSLWQTADICVVIWSTSGSNDGDGDVGCGDGVTSSNTMVDPPPEAERPTLWTVSIQKYSRPNRPPSHHAGEDGVAGSLGRGGRETALR